MTNQEPINDYAIARHAKCHEKDVSASYRHAMRLQNTPNANAALLQCNMFACEETQWNLVQFNPTNTNQQIFFKDTFLINKIRARIEQLGIKSLRQDAVLAVEVHLSLSPQFIRDGDESGPLNQQKVDAQTKAALRYLRKKYGDNLLTAIVHLDETNPHICAYVLPAIRTQKKKRGRPSKVKSSVDISARDSWTLSAKVMFGPQQCSLAQDEFADTCKLEGLNVRRGIRGSRTPHQTMRAHLSLVHSVTPVVEPITLLNPREGMEGVLQSKREYFEEAQADIAEKVAHANQQLEIFAAKARERDREVSQRKAYQCTAADKGEQLAKTQDVLIATQKAVVRLQEQINQLADKVRDIPLTRIVESLGLLEIEPAIFNSQKGTIRVHEKGFVNLASAIKGRNAIDLTRHILDCNFETAVRWLLTYFPEQANGAVENYTAQKVSEVLEIAETKGRLTPDESIQLIAPPSEMKWPELQAQLVQNYTLPPAKLAEWHASKIITATESGNVACVLRDPINPEQSPTGVAIFSPNALMNPLQRVGDLALAFVIQSKSSNSEQPTVIASNPGEAMSFAVLHPDSGLVVAPAGKNSLEPILISLAQIRRQIVLALTLSEDSLEPKAIMCRALSSFGDVAASVVDLLVKTLKPVFQSWSNDLLNFKTAANYPAEQSSRTAQNPQGISRT